MAPLPMALLLSLVADDDAAPLPVPLVEPELTRALASTNGPRPPLSLSVLLALLPVLPLVSVLPVVPEDVPDADVPEPVLPEVEPDDEPRMAFMPCCRQPVAVMF